MRGIRLVVYFVLVCLTSFYFFPFAFSFLPAVNTKMMLAAVGLVLFLIQMARGRSGEIGRTFFGLSLLAVAVSLVAYASAVINGTRDYTYATYIVSMWVWLGGAYGISKLIQGVHGKLSVVLVSNYLIAVCVLQCILALIIDASPQFCSYVNRIVADLGFIEMDRLSGAGRLYGIGCCLDVAGTRFAAVLLIISFVTCRLSGIPSCARYLWLYLLAFVIILIFGNMIARTTIVGFILAVFVWLRWGTIKEVGSRSLWKQLALIMGISLIVTSVLYFTDAHFRMNLRFAFEGFFNLIEHGRWETNSNSILANMVVFPDSLHTWLIGDGYMLSPASTDPFYVGDYYGGGFYKNTDIGYLRFIFYFGVVGLLLFASFFHTTAITLANTHAKYYWMFVFLLILNYIIWMKVSTDIFLVFAIYLCISRRKPIRA